MRALEILAEMFANQGQWATGFIEEMEAGQAKVNTYGRVQPRTKVPLLESDTNATGVDQLYLTSRYNDLPAPAGASPWIS